MDVDDDRRARGTDGYLQAMRRWRCRAAAAEIEQQRVADFDCEACLVAALGRFNLQDVYCAELVAQYRPPGGRSLAIEGLEAAASESGNRQRRDARQELVSLHGTSRARIMDGAARESTSLMPMAVGGAAGAPTIRESNQSPCCGIRGRAMVETVDFRE